MATLPEGRKPLTDEELVILLRTVAKAFTVGGSKTTAEDLHQAAERLHDLTEKSSTHHHWTGHK